MKKYLIVSLIIIVLILGYSRVRENSRSKLVEAKQDIGSREQRINEEMKDYVEENDDGTKINKNSKLIEERTLGNLKISNILLTSKDYETSFMADVENMGTEVKKETEIQISLFDENEELIISFPGKISKTEPGATSKINVTLSDSDFTNAYNVEIVEK